MTLSGDWSTAIDDYLAFQRAGGATPATVYSRRQHLQHMARRIEIAPWAMTADELTTWTGEQDWSLSTRRGRRTTFQSFYAWGRRTKRIKRDPAKYLPRVKSAQARPRPCPDRVYLEALIAADAAESLMLELAADHGMRRAEIAIVHSRDIVEDLVGHSLVVHGKGQKDRIVPLTLRMASKLLELEPGYVFPGDIDGHISPRWLGKRVNALLGGSWTIHTLRHRAGTRWNSEGGLLVAQGLLGHASVATTQVYCKVDDGEARRTLLAMAS